MRLWVIAYDVADNERRYLLSIHLSERMERVQESVFEGWLHATEFKEIWQVVQQLVDAKEDLVRAYPLAVRTPHNYQTYGLQKATAPAPQYWIL